VPVKLHIAAGVVNTVFSGQYRDISTSSLLTWFSWIEPQMVNNDLANWTDHIWQLEFTVMRGLAYGIPRSSIWQTFERSCQLHFTTQCRIGKRCRQPSWESADIANVANHHGPVNTPSVIAVHKANQSIAAIGAWQGVSSVNGFTFDKDCGWDGVPARNQIPNWAKCKVWLLIGVRAVVVCDVTFPDRGLQLRPP
jgi:hypothetical protein